MYLNNTAIILHNMYKNEKKKNRKKCTYIEVNKYRRRLRNI